MASRDQHAAGEKEEDDVDGYEQLRRQALAGDAGGWRLGLAVLQHRGMATWLRVRASTSTAGPPRPKPQPTDRAVVAGAAEDLVGLLASMALGALARG